MTDKSASHQFCTITTSDYLFKVFALHDSLMAVNDQFCLHILVIDDPKPVETKPSMVYYGLDHLDTDLAQSLKSKYAKDRDRLRWVLKPVFLNALLQTNYKVVYLDNDMACFSSFGFLFDELEDHSMLLTPHYYQRNPRKDQQWLEANFKVGLYNAGFIGANQSAQKLLNWWANCCLYRCEKNSIRGLFDDQKYLDLLPIMDRKVEVLASKGCNVASWNRENCHRVEVDGSVLIDGVWPIVFIHFNAYTLRHILEEDNMLQKHFDIYHKLLLKYQPTWQIPKKYAGTWDGIKLNMWKVLNKLNNRHLNE